MIPKSIQRFIDIFSALPSMGPRQATRLAFYLIGLGKSSLLDISDAVRGLESLTVCPECFFVSDKECPFCSNPRRVKDIVAIVERPTDILAIEKTKRFNGQYLVLGELKKTGMLEPDQKLKLQYLKSRFATPTAGGPLKEIILALNQTTYADFNASIIAKELAGVAPKLSRLGRGIPTGGEIEFADEDTLGSAIDKRG